LRQQITDALLAHCEKTLPACKVRHGVHLIAEIPRTGSGKIIRYKLREMLRA
jgi:long-chain acyl-CoA synthetase